MRSMKTAFPLCAMVLFSAVVLLPHAGMSQRKLTRTAPEANGCPILTVDGGDPVPKVPTPKPLPPPTPPPSNNALAA